eukprot:scaffold77749_cov59-Phaeocystis_antarctica.AAC.3
MAIRFECAVAAHGRQHVEWRVAARHGATRHRGAVARLPKVSRAIAKFSADARLPVDGKALLTYYGEARQQHVGGLPLLLAQRGEQRRLACNARRRRLRH